MEVAQVLKRSQATVQSWFNKFRKGGVKELLVKKKGNGPKSELTPEIQEAMIKQLELGQWRTGRNAI